MLSACADTDMESTLIWVPYLPCRRVTWTKDVILPKVGRARIGFTSSRLGVWMGVMKERASFLKWASDCIKELVVLLLLLLLLLFLLL